MKRTIFIMILFSLHLFIFSESYYSGDFYFSLDLPSEWYLVDDSDGYHAFFQNERETAFLEVSVFDLSSALTNAELFDSFLVRFNASGTYNDVSFCRYDAERGIVSFNYDGSTFKMDMVILKDDYYFYAIMGYSYRDYYRSFENILNDIIMSFKIHYDNVIFSNDYQIEDFSETPYNSEVEDHITKYNKYEDSYDELRSEWDYYKPIFKFLRKDYLTAQEELKEILEPDSWGYYDVDPYNDLNCNKTFWHRFYIDMYNKNYYRVNDVVTWFKDKYKSEGWSTYDLACNIIKALQVIEYGHPAELAEEDSVGGIDLGFFTPNEVAYYQKGDCDTKSLFIVILLRHFGFDAVMYYSEVYRHAMAGININATGYYKKYNGKKYFFIESTYPGWQIGDLSDEWNDLDNWYLLPIE